MEIRLSDHAEMRAVQWNLSYDEIEFIILKAHRERRTGVIFCQMWDKKMPASVRPNDAYRRLVGATVVLCGQCGYFVVTLYRNPEAFHRDSKKAKYNLKEQYGPCPRCDKAA